MQQQPPQVIHIAGPVIPADQVVQVQRGMDKFGVVLTALMAAAIGFGTGGIILGRHKELELQERYYLVPKSDAVHNGVRFAPAAGPGVPAPAPQQKPAAE